MLSTEKVTGLYFFFFFFVKKKKAVLFFYKIFTASADF